MVRPKDTGLLEWGVGKRERGRWTQRDNREL
jgi:hypothetical protein